MPAPKRKHSRSRSRKRRTHYKAAMPTITICPNCGAPKLPHRACRNCGYYKDRPVLMEKTKE